MVKLPFESMTTEFQSWTSNHDDGLYLYANQAGCLINPCLIDWRKTMGSRNDCPLDEPPKVAWKWGSWDKDPSSSVGTAVPLLHTGISGAVSWGFWTVVRLSSWHPSQYWFSKLGRLLPWNPVKRTAAAKRSVSWSSAGDASSCAWLWHIPVGYWGMWDHKCCPAAELLPESSSLYRGSCAVFVYSPGLPRPDERSKHPSAWGGKRIKAKTDNSEGYWSCFPFCNFPHDSL